MDQGKLVPDNVMIEVVMEDATPHLENGNSLLLDGFPRTLEQAQAFDEVARIDWVVNLDIPTETIVERIADRYDGLTLSSFVTAVAGFLRCQCLLILVHRSYFL
jgi:adenylate kinase family enzyme